MQLIESSLIAGSIWKLFKSRTTSVESSPKARKFLLKPFWKQAEFSSKLFESRINCQNTQKLPQNQRFRRAPLLCFWLAVSDLAKVTIIMRPHLNLDGQYFWQNSVESEWKYSYVTICLNCKVYGLEHSNGGLITFPGGIPLIDPEGVFIGSIEVRGYIDLRNKGGNWKFRLNSLCVCFVFFAAKYKVIICKR